MPYENMVPFNWLEADFEKVEQVLQQYGEAVVIRGDQPRYRLTLIAPPPAGGREESRMSAPENAGAGEARLLLRRLTVQEKAVLRRKLDSIGKSVFIRYYKQFQNREDPLTFMEEDFTEASKRARSSCARYIFQMGWERHALRYILDSGRTAAEVRDRAQALLETCG